MQRLSNFDAIFLRMERPGLPMHVGATLVFDAPADGPMTLERLRAHVARRLQTARLFRERLLMPATLLENPLWVADRPVDLDWHIGRALVPGAIDDAALAGLREQFFGELLPRDRPLWKALLVEEEAGGSGRFALLVKVHHAAVDGVSAEAVLAGLLDPGVTPRPLPPDTWQPEQAPAPASLLRSIRNATRGAPRREVVALQRAMGRRILRRVRDSREKTLPYPFLSPKTRFNTAVGARRSYASAQLPLSVLKQVRRAHADSKLNDVVLAVCSGALRRYLGELDELPAKSLVAMAPISKRAPGEAHRQGNLVSSLFVTLATDVADPRERLSRITHSTRLAKDYNRDMPTEVLLDSLPPASPALFCTAWKHLGLSRRAPPMFSVAITNVPGSPVPLYLDGAQLRSIAGMAGIYDGFGLVLVVTSYAGSLSISLTSTPELMPDPQRFIACLHEALGELVAASEQVNG